MTTPGQTIHFGLALDGERGWHPTNSLGVSHVGPLGFMSLLEAQLGIAYPRVSGVERVAQMASCLREAANGQRFYERSLAVDEIGTASTLLRWRDTWNEAGWRGEVPPAATGRIADMVAVETLARGRVAPGIGERLAEIEAALDNRDPGIAVVKLYDRLEEHTAMWRRVLAKLPVSPVDELKPKGAAGTMLRALQEALASHAHGGKGPRIPWKEDGSVQVVRGETVLASSAWLAAELKQIGEDVLLVMEQEGGIADAALAAVDLAREGISPPSPARPALQVLPLALRLLWSPLDFGALLAFLTLPDGPIPGFVRRRLAAQVASSPGIGGEEWTKRIGEILETKETPDAKAKLRADIAYWVESPRHNPKHGAPIAVVIERVVRVAEYFRARSQNEDPAIAEAASGGLAQASALANALRIFQAQGRPQVSAAELDRLVEQATGMGGHNPERGAQAGSRCVISSPGAALEAFDEVIWWRLASIPIPGADPWSATEVAQLEAGGAELLGAEVRLTTQARGWLAPVFQARKRITLMLPREGVELHPLWIQLIAPIDVAPIREIESVLTEPATKGRTSTVPFRPRPARRRWWSLPKEVKIPWPEHSSFSSLEHLLFDPNRWVLNYAARIRPSSLLELPGENQLLGQLAHRIVERLYLTPGSLDWNEEQVATWTDGCLERTVAEEGAILLMPGRRSDLEAFRLRLRRAVVDLHARLHKAGARRVWPEKSLECHTALGKLVGYIDLHVEHEAGPTSVVDMKWSGSSYASKVNTNTHIQLAVYGKLVEMETGRWPAVAYYILRSRDLLTRDDELFAGQRESTTAGITAELWEKVVDAWRWRRAQLDAGAIEVVRDDVEADESVEGPPLKLAIEPLWQDYNRYRFLDGWGEGE